MGDAAGRERGAARAVEDTAPWVATAAVCALGAALAAPEWVPHEWSREDGPLEYATFACFVVSSLAALAASARLRSAGRLALAAAALGLVLFVAAGEEVSWGQRWFGLETPDALVDGNRQDELNLHNVEGLQDKAVLAQLGIAAAGIALALRVPRRWARAGLPFFAGYAAYRTGRGVGAVVEWGAADRNSEAAELLLAVGLLTLTLSLLAELRVRARADAVVSRGALARPAAPLPSRRRGSAPARPPVARPG